MYTCYANVSYIYILCSIRQAVPTNDDDDEKFNDEMPSFQPAAIFSLGPTTILPRRDCVPRTLGRLLDSDGRLVWLTATPVNSRTAVSPSCFYVFVYPRLSRNVHPAPVHLATTSLPNPPDPYQQTPVTIRDRQTTHHSSHMALSNRSIHRRRSTPWIFSTQPSTPNC